MCELDREEIEHASRLSLAVSMWRRLGFVPFTIKLLRFACLRCIRSVLSAYNSFRRLRTYTPPTDVPELRQVQSRALAHTDINEHLVPILIESLLAEPDTIVELGVRGGQSTFVLERVARLTGAQLVSVDLDDCSHVINYDKWVFVQADDVVFGRQFKDWCTQTGVDPRIDVLFIDSSHLYEHTVREIEVWFPHLSDRAVVVFHDTNMRRFYRRRDGTIGSGWNNDRGVVRAIEDYLGCGLDETRTFVTVHSGFVIRHNPFCSGLTIMRKLASLPESD